LIRGVCILVPLFPISFSGGHNNNNKTVKFSRGQPPKIKRAFYDEKQKEMRGAIVAWLEAIPGIDVPRATEALLDALEGRMTAAKLAVFLECVMAPVVRFGVCNGKYTLYLYETGRYERGATRDALWCVAQAHVRSLAALGVAFPGRETARVISQGPFERLEARCRTTRIVHCAVARMLGTMRATMRAETCGAEAFECAMDGGDYIGFRNGVYDLGAGCFIPSGRVPASVLVSMSTGYDYCEAGEAGEAGEAVEAEIRVEIAEYYRDTFGDAADAAWQFSGSLLRPGPKRAVAFVGDGTAFLDLLERTLGDYCVAGEAARGARKARVAVRASAASRVQGLCARLDGEERLLTTPVLTTGVSAPLAGRVRAIHVGNRMYLAECHRWRGAHFKMMLEARGP
jgi:hypothetical protein